MPLAVRGTAPRLAMKSGTLGGPAQRRGRVFGQDIRASRRRWRSERCLCPFRALRWRAGGAQNVATPVGQLSEIVGRDGSESSC